jgi:hypothetical protein
MATIVAAAGGGSWASTATWTGGVVPTAADDVQLSSSSGNVTIAAAAACRSLDCTGYTGTLTHNSGITLSIGDATAGASNIALKLVAGMTYVLGNAATSAISFVSTSTTQQTIATGGQTLGNWTQNGVGSSLLLADANTVGPTATVTNANGIFNTGSQTCNWGLFVTSPANARTITFGSSAVTITGTGQVITINAQSLSISANTSVWTLTGANAIMKIASGTPNMNGLSVVFSGSGTADFGLAGGGTFANVTRTGTASKTDTFTMGPSTITGTLTINGNSSANRVLVCSSTLGTAVTVTAAAVSISNSDFRDITKAGAANWNLSAISGGAGDAGGNTGITFTTAATQYWSGTTGNWSDASKWFLATGGTGGAGRVPLPQDDVVFDASSFTTTGQTVTADMARLGKSITWTGVTNTPTLTRSVANTIYGSLTLASGMTTTSDAFDFIFEGRSTFTLTSAGKSLNTGTSANFLTVQMFGGTMTLQDALDYRGTSGLQLNNGTFNANGFDATIASLQSSNSNTRTLTMGSGNWTLVGTGTVWNIATATSLTLSAASSTITLSRNDATSRTFAGNGKTYGNFTVGSLGTGAAIVTGANTFATVTVQGVHTLTLPASTTTTATGFVAGSAGNTATINSSTSGTAATLSIASGAVSVDYVSIKDSTATGGATFNAGPHSTNVSNNTGWVFAPPLAGGNMALFG